MKLQIKTPPAFSFKRTAISHGWCQLLPFELDEEAWAMKCVFDVGTSKPVAATITGSDSEIVVETTRDNLGVRAQRKILKDVRHIFRLDDDMEEFYQSISADPDFAWIARAGAGRMLRSATVFEDLVKTICTTNCSWSLTLKMVSGLTNMLGRESAAGARAFPTPDAMAERPVDFYRDEVRAGYRAPYLKLLA